jgi:hypothetical protein
MWAKSPPPSLMPTTMAGWCSRSRSICGSGIGTCAIGGMS